MLTETILRFYKASNENKVIIEDDKNVLPFSNQPTWIKKENRLFDLTVGPYNSAEDCEVFRIFILYHLSLKYNKSNKGSQR